MSNYTHSVSLQSLLSSKTGLSNSDLIELGMKCGASAHNLRISAQNIKVQNKGNNTQDFFSQINHFISSLTDIWKGPTGIEISSFPMMRKHIQMQYLNTISTTQSTQNSPFLIQNNIVSDFLQYNQSRVCRLSIEGCDGNLIDGVLISNIKMSIETIRLIYEKTQTNNPSPSFIYTPTVLFCCPNAGFYECLVMAQSNSSWLGFYLARGYYFIIYFVIIIFVIYYYYYRNEYCCF